MNSTGQPIPVYLISLDSAPERRRSACAQLDALGIRYQVLPAVQGKALDESERRRINPGGNMSPGAIGCYLSHIGVYERFLATDAPVALVLEDDVLLHPSVRTLVAEGCRSIDFDYCFLGSEDWGTEGYVFYDAARPIELARGLRAFPLSSGPYCTHAYLVTRAGAQRRLSCALPARSSIDHYAHLPYRPHFTAVVPMVGFLSPINTVDSLSSTSWGSVQRLLHSKPWFYPVRDALKLRSIAKFVAQRSQARASGRWRPFRSGARVVSARALND